MDSKLVVDCSTGEAQRVDLTPEEQADLDTRNAGPDVFAIQRAEWEAFRDRLATEIAWLETEIAGAPAAGTTTSGNAVARVDGLIQHVKKLDRGLLRLARNMRDGLFDSEA